MKVLVVLFMATLAVLTLLFVIGPDTDGKYADNGRGVYLPHAQKWALPRERTDREGREETPAAHPPRTHE